jgi:tetratricopeptide (TPR) repeat protein
VRAVTLLSLIALRAWLPSTASAGEPEPSAAVRERDAHAQFELGRAHFKLGEYDLAIRAFEAGYTIAKLPLFLYNIAQSARLAGHAAQAIDYYRRYLEAAPDAPERAAIELHVAALTKQLESLVRPAATPAIPALAAAQPLASTRPPTPTKRIRRGVWVGVSVGATLAVAAGLAIGLTLGLPQSAPTTRLGNYLPYSQ